MQRSEPPATGGPNLVAIATRLRIDAATAEVFRSFDRTGVRALLLKGPSIAHWLYADGEPRTYVDCDLLVAPADLEAAQSRLESLGYRQSFDDREMPSWWREHASVWVREDGVSVDLHRTLPGVGADAETAWRLLAADPDVVAVAAVPTPTLALPARALHVALHAAQHGVSQPGPIGDLGRALSAGDEKLWRRAAQLAAELQATDGLSAGLRLLPEGTELAARLGLPATPSVDAQLRAASAPPSALSIERLARAKGIRARAEFVWRKLVPPASFVRHWDPGAAESRAALLRAYARRPVWIVRRAPRAVRAWRQAVRDGQGRDSR